MKIQIGYIGSCAVLLLGLTLINSVSRQTETGGDVFIATEKQIGRIDFTQIYSEITPQLPDNSMSFGQYAISLDKKELYFIGFSDTKRILYRYNYAAGIVDDLFQHPNLATITTPSPENTRMLLGLFDFETPANSAICQFVFSSGECYITDLNIPFSNFYWLNDNTFFVTNVFEISIYQLGETDETNLLYSYTFDDGDFLGPSTMLPDNNGTIAAIFYDASDAYTPSLLMFDTQALERKLLSNISIIDYGAAVDRIEMSPNRELLAYEVNHKVVIINLSTGQIINELDDIESSAWYSNDDMVISRWTEGAYQINLWSIFENSLNEITWLHSETFSFVP